MPSSVTHIYSHIDDHRVENRDRKTEKPLAAICRESEAANTLRVSGVDSPQKGDVIALSVTRYGSGEFFLVYMFEGGDCRTSRLMLEDAERISESEMHPDREEAKMLLAYAASSETFERNPKYWNVTDGSFVFDPKAYAMDQSQRSATLVPMRVQWVKAKRLAEAV